MAKKESKKEKKPVAAKEGSKVEVAEKTQEAEGVRFGCMGHGLKDLSFECPAPGYMVGNVEQELALNLSVGVMPRQNPENSWEVTLAMRAEAKKDGQMLFLVEQAYAGLFHVTGLPDEQRDMVLHVDGAAMLFPFARHNLMQVIGEGGYRPPMLDPVNFMALYQQHLQRQQQMAENAPSN